MKFKSYIDVIVKFMNQNLYSLKERKKLIKNIFYLSKEEKEYAKKLFCKKCNNVIKYNLQGVKILCHK